MKINDTARIYRLQAYQSAERSREGQGAVGTGSGKRDGVTISSAALDMARDTYEADELRAERLAEVKESIQNGSYQVDLRKVAEKLYESFMR
ncbi:flagellar biosynthesis anti-sigma factor FlgM [Tumebacillus lipolyticus]|uniref:Negative regulator of flagellin synthesis n=1 Tax=Tumebacillus lipolyticus TaxID=1280370 RepID=A0ABW4ZX63_9BACL